MKLVFQFLGYFIFFRIFAKMRVEKYNLKYKYCEEFRKVLDKYSDKFIVEDSHWGDYFAGALLDETSGKYRGCNVFGRVIMRVRYEKDIIMKE